MGSSDRQWYSKYRPMNVSEYYDDRIKSTVKRRFTSEEKRPNVVMVYGPSGCGKTTICRMLSKYYHCLSPNQDGTPCEKCEMCTTINERLIYGEDGVECDGVLEVDATKANKEQMEEIIDEALIAPIFGNKKVLILDECHKLSPSTQSILLKVLEEIPRHLVVMMATTDIDKVLDTILNRCQVKLEVHKQSIASMVEVLLGIAQKENITVSKKALEAIARHGDRVPRECINTLEDVSKNFDGKVTLENVNEICNNINTEVYLNFYESANSSLEDILLYNQKIKGMNIEYRKLIDGIMKFTLEAMYIRYGINIDEYTKDFVKVVRKLFNTYSSSDFDMLLQVLEYASKMITSDDYRNEVVITTTAMRVSKINMLSKGIELSKGEAAVENSESLVKHIKTIKEEAVLVDSQVKEELDLDYLDNNFNDLGIVNIDATTKELLMMAAMESENSEEDTNSSDESVVNYSKDEIFDGL